MIRNNIDFSHQSRIVLLSSIYVLMRERFCEITTDNEHVPIVFTLVSHRSQFPQCVTTTTSLLIWGILYLILSSLLYRRLMYVNYFDGILQLKHYPTSCRTLQFNKGAPFSFSKQALYPHMLCPCWRFGQLWILWCSSWIAGASSGGKKS